MNALERAKSTVDWYWKTHGTAPGHRDLEMATGDEVAQLVDIVADLALYSTRRFGIGLYKLAEMAQLHVDAEAAARSTDSLRRCPGDLGCICPKEADPMT